MPVIPIIYHLHNNTKVNTDINKRPREEPERQSFPPSNLDFMAMIIEVPKNILGIYIANTPDGIPEIGESGHQHNPGYLNDPSTQQTSQGMRKD